jgi:hypothetical protein
MSKLFGKIAVVNTGDKPFRKFVTLEEDRPITPDYSLQRFSFPSSAFLLNLPGRDTV